MASRSAMEYKTAVVSKSAAASRLAAECWSAGVVARVMAFPSE